MCYQSLHTVVDKMFRYLEEIVVQEINIIMKTHKSKLSPGYLPIFVADILNKNKINWNNQEIDEKCSPQENKYSLIFVFIYCESLAD